MVYIRSYSISDGITGLITDETAPVQNGLDSRLFCDSALSLLKPLSSLHEVTVDTPVPRQTTFLLQTCYVSADFAAGKVSLMQEKRL
jgi:hypothetical protein